MDSNKIKEGFTTALMIPVFILWSIAGPVTYILNVVDTWRGSASVMVKILINLTLDALLAAIWPITWFLCIIMHLNGKSTPLRILFG